MQGLELGSETGCIQNRIWVRISDLDTAKLERLLRNRSDAAVLLVTEALILAPIVLHQRRKPYGERHHVIYVSVYVSVYGSVYGRGG